MGKSCFRAEGGEKRVESKKRRRWREAVFRNMGEKERISSFEWERDAREICNHLGGCGRSDLVCR